MKSLSILLAVCVVVSIAISSCRRTNEGPPPPTPPDSASTYLLDSSVYIIKDTNLSTGVFHYTTGSHTLPLFKKGDFFIEPRNFGYLRKITGVNLSNGELFFNTEQATIYDAFKRYGDISGKFSIPRSINPFIIYTSGHSKKSLVETNSAAGANGVSNIQGSFPEFTVPVPGLDVTFTRFLIGFEPLVNARFSASNKTFFLGIDSTSLIFSYALSIQKANDDVTNRTDTFHLQKYFPPDLSNLFNRIPFEIPGSEGLPLIGDINIDLLLVLKYDGSKSVSDEIWVGQQRQFAMNVNYQNGNLDANFKFDLYPGDFWHKTMSNNSNRNISVSLIPVYQFRFYNVPLISIDIQAKTKAEIENSPDLSSWDEFGISGFQGTADLDNSLLGFFPKTETKVSPEERIDTAYTAPAKIVSTNPYMPTGKTGDNIPFSIQLQDSRGAALLFPTTVYYFTDKGSWDVPKMLSSPNSGSVTNNFTLGAGTNNTQIKVYDAGNNVLTYLNTSFIGDSTAVGGAGLNLVSIGPYPVPGMVPAANGSPDSVYIASGRMVFTQGAANFNVNVFGASNVDLYSGSAIVNYYGHENGGQPYFVPTDVTYPGSQNNPGWGWGCLMPPGYEMFFTIGGNGYIGDHTFDNRYTLILPIGYCIFQ